MTSWPVRSLHRQVKKLQSTVRFGSPAKRKQKLQDAIPRLSVCATRLEDSKHTLSQAFVLEQERWGDVSV